MHTQHDILQRFLGIATDCLVVFAALDRPLAPYTSIHLIEIL